MDDAGMGERLVAQRDRIPLPRGCECDDLAGDQFHEPRFTARQVEHRKIVGVAEDAEIARLERETAGDVGVDIAHSRTPIRLTPVHQTVGCGFRSAVRHNQSR